MPQRCSFSAISARQCSAVEQYAATLFKASVSVISIIVLQLRTIRRLLNYYVRDLGFKSDKELWVGTESGLYIYDLEKGEIAHLTVSNGFPSRRHKAGE